MAKHRRFTRGGIAAVLSATIVAATFVVATPSQAAFPGLAGLIAYVNAGGNVFVVNPSNPVPTQVTNTGQFSTVNYNATGNKLVASGTGSIVTLDPVAGSAVTVVPNTSGADSAPAFNPDGTKLVFVNNNGLSTIDVAGSNRTTIVNQGVRPDWSADGTFIAFDNNAGTQILRVNPNGGQPVVLATAGVGGNCAAATPCLYTSVSPDNKFVAFTRRTAAGGGGIARVASDGSTAANSTTLSTNPGAAGTEDGSPAYAPDGARLAFQRGPIGNGALTTVPTDGSQTATAVGAINTVTDVSWGVQSGGTGTGTGTGGSVISVSATRNGANCVFNITATPAAAGITVDFSITSNKGKEKLAGNDVTVPASPSIKAKKRGRNKVRNITLSDPKGATIGTGAATCAKK